MYEYMLKYSSSYWMQIRTTKKRLSRNGARGKKIIDYREGLSVYISVCAVELHFNVLLGSSIFHL